MFVPPILGTAILVLWFVGGSLLGAFIGYFSSDLLHLDRKRPWLDAVTGAAAMLLLMVLTLLVSRGTTTVINGHTLGRRGIVLDHLLIWGLSMTCLAVVGRQLCAACGQRPVRAHSSPQSDASGHREP